ncbi:MAG TPA: hypothetical protein VGI47_11375 [Candidatus Binataceae bacterium]|jgi:hypothetical protein
MRLRTDNRRVVRKGIATMAAVLIVVAQLAGAIHSHQWGGALGRGGAASVAVDNSLCALCQIASHGQAGFSAPPELAAPTSSVERTPPAVELSLVGLFLSSPHGRAPPATA